MNLLALSLLPLGAPVLVLGLGIAFAWAMLGATRRNTTKGKLHLEATKQQASSMYASGGISRRALYLVWIYVGNCICTYVCVYTV